MKPFIVAALLTAVFPAMGQDTYPTLTTLDGTTYTNAEISSHTASYAVVFWEGGGKKIPFTNLPPEIQKKYNFDAAAAAASDAAVAQKQAALNKRFAQQAAEITKLQSQLGAPQRIRVLKIINGSTVQISTGGMLQQAYIHNLPYAVMSFVKDLTTTQAAVQGDKHSVYHDAVGGTSQSVYSRQALQAENKQHLDDLEGCCPYGSRAKGITTIVARSSEYMISPGVRQWEYQGALAPDPDN